MTDVIFLGAGASKPFGIPTMIEFPNKIEKLLSGEQQELFRHIRHVLQENGVIEDLETIFTVLNEYRSAGELTKLSPNVLYRYYEEIRKSVNHTKRLERDIESLREQVQQIIRKMCTLKEPDINDKIYETYENFFQSLKDYYGFSDTAPLLHIYNFDIFTTNYDTCIEIFFDRARFEKDDDNILLDDGVSSDRRHWSPYNYGDRRNKLFKLHGSIDLQITDRGFIKYFGELPKVLRERRKGDLMIFPVRGKYVYEYPFFEMFIELRKALLQASKVIIVGFSFRDEAIRDIFRSVILRRENLYRKKTGRILRLILIDPMATKVKNKELRSISDKVIPIDGKFEESSTLDALRGALQKA